MVLAPMPKVAARVSGLLPHVVGSCQRHGLETLRSSSRVQTVRLRRHYSYDVCKPSPGVVEDPFRSLRDSGNTTHRHWDARGCVSPTGFGASELSWPQNFSKVPKLLRLQLPVDPFRHFWSSGLFLESP